MLEKTPHQTDAIALEETTCLEVSRDDIAVLLQRKPLAGMDMLTVSAGSFTPPSNLCAFVPIAIPTKSSKRKRRLANASPIRSVNSAAPGRLSSRLQSWQRLYRGEHTLGKDRLDPYPFILLNLFLSLLAASRRPSS